MYLHVGRGIFYGSYTFFYAHVQKSVKELLILYLSSLKESRQINLLIDFQELINDHKVKVESLSSDSFVSLQH